MKRTFRNILLVVGFLAAGQLSNAAPLRPPRVSAVIRDVRLLPSNAAPRPAAVNDNVGLGTAVRTGTESRAELTFADLTITRLGQNTIFSFNEAARELNVTSGAILVEVPSKAPAAKINTAAVTAGVMGGTALFATGPPIKFMVLEGTGTFYPAGHPEEAVTLHGGEMVMMTADGRITQPTKFDVALVLETSQLIVDFPDLTNLPLILDVINQQLAEASAGTLNPLPSKNPLDVIDVVVQNVTANPAVVTFTATPSPAPIGPPVIRSPVPYVINNGTTIVTLETHPTITTNGVTDSGRIYRGQSIDGPLSAFLFGSTSGFDTANGFDTLVGGGGGGGIGGNGTGAAFKFTSLELAGDPAVSTTNGEINLGLVGVNGITSGAPGGTLTFAGIRGLLLATQDGPITLGSGISFSGLHDINIYARGSLSDLTLGSDINTSRRVLLLAERDMFVTSNITTEELVARAGRNIALSDPAIIHAETITLSAGQDLTWNGQTSDETALNTDGNVDISAGNRISITGALEIDRRFGGSPTGLNISFDAGTDLTAGNGLTILVDNSVSGNLDSGANISLNTGNNLTINGGGALSLTVANNGGGHIGTGGNISVTTGGDLTAGSMDALINNRNGGSIDSGGNMTFNIGGALNIANDASLVISMRNTFGTGGGTVGSDVAVNVSAGSVSTGGGFTTVVSTNGGGNISGSASNNVNITGDFVTQGDSSVTIQNTGFNSVNPYNFVAGGNITGDTAVTLSARNITSSSTDSGTPVPGLLTNSIEASIYNDGSGHIGGNALVNVTASGDITTPGGAVFAIFNNNFGFGGGTVVGDATVDVSANNITANALTAQIDNTGGSIGGNATINMNVSGSANVTGDATVEILGSNGAAKGAAINFNGGSYGVGGTFLSTIDGDGVITFNNASIRADIVKVGVFGNNGTLTIGTIGTIGGGTISANTLLKLYAPGSNGTLNFVANVTLSSGTAAILAANTITIQPKVLVMIAGNGGPANIFTNNPNYNFTPGPSYIGPPGNPLNGSFGGKGAFDPQPLANAPSFIDPPISPSSGAAGAVTQTLSSANVASSGKVNGGLGGARQKSGELAVPNAKATRATINVGSSAQLLSMLDAAAPGPGGKITIPASKSASNSSNSNRTNAGGRLKAGRGTVDARHARDRAVINSTTRTLAGAGVNNPQPLASARSFVP